MAYRTWEVKEHEGRIYVMEANPRKRRGFGECYRFPDREKAEAYAAERRSRDEAREEKIVARRAERASARRAIVNPYKVGDIFHYSWGYEQTNCEFYQVVAVSPKTVTIREIASTTVPGSEGFMSDRRGAVPGKFLEKAKPLRKTLQPGDPPYITMEFGAISRCNPEDAFSCTWYA